jgi:sugar O-acyltransferase (sialic acid O-acetyltransferase NeuD family)
MLVIGAKGFAKEILEVLHQINDIENLMFYDDVNDNISNELYHKFKILRTESQAGQYFKEIDSRFTIGIGKPLIREKIYKKFKSLGGVYTSTISAMADLGNYDIKIKEGNNIMGGAIISNGVKTGIGCIIYFNAVITHDVQLGKFVEISPSANLLGRCKIGDYTEVGSNSTILPDIVIGSNVIVAAGAVVTKNIPDNCMVAGVPAVIKKYFD